MATAAHTPATDSPRLPRHVAFIMDGNGRWAEARGQPRVAGHQAGAETVRRVTTFARRRGLECLTLYAFSTENWARPRDEVDALMHLLAEYIEAELPTLMENDIRLRIIGDVGALSPTLRGSIADAIFATADNGAMVLSVAINYGGRDEIVRACRRAYDDLRRSELGLEALDQDFLSARMDTAGLPDPDLLIRTAGEQRLSNFLIWQSAYTEFLFCERTWPEFSDKDFEDALAEYAARVRKFGGSGVASSNQLG